MQYRNAITLGLVFLAAPGCAFHGYPNGYYGPGTSVVPPSSGFPSGPFYQPGGTYSAPLNGGPIYTPSGTPGTSPGVAPGTTSPTPATPGLNPTYDNSTPATNGNSPGFNENPPNRTVPPPDDDGSFNRGTQRPSLTPTSSTSNSEPDEETPFSQTESRRSPRPSYAASELIVESDTQFEPPEVRQTSSYDGNTEVQFASVPERAKGPAYGHDPKYRWVQGVVEYDEASEAWFIMYDEQATDQFGGDLALANHRLLKQLKSGDAVRIEGSLDDTELDSRGKPMFRLTQVKKL
jgi:hypothetical protein